MYIDNWSNTKDQVFRSIERLGLYGGILLVLFVHQDLLLQPVASTLWVCFMVCSLRSTQTLTCWHVVALLQACPLVQRALLFALFALFEARELELALHRSRLFLLILCCCRLHHLHLQLFGILWLVLDRRCTKIVTTMLTGLISS